MTYQLERVPFDALDRLYPPGEEEAVAMATATTKRAWRQNMFGCSWAIDRQSGDFLLWLPGVRLDSSKRYLFGTRQGVAVIQEHGYCLYSISYVSPALLERVTTIKDGIREAFRVAGAHVDGTTDPNGMWAVPDAQFTA